MKEIKVVWKDTGWKKETGRGKINFGRKDTRQVGPFTFEILSESDRWAGASLHIRYLKCADMPPPTAEHAAYSWYRSVREAKEKVETFLKEILGEQKGEGYERMAKERNIT